MIGRVKQNSKDTTFHNPFDDAVVVSSYTDRQAIQDGVLVNLGEFHRHWQRSVVNIVTANLLRSKGYIPEEVSGRITPLNFDWTTLTDLVNSAIELVKNKIQGDTSPGYLYTDLYFIGPDGVEFEAWAQRNQSGFYTLLLPSDY